MVGIFSYQFGIIINDVRDTLSRVCFISKTALNVSKHFRMRSVVLVEDILKLQI